MTTIGALNEYIHDYTKCVNECDFYNSDKTKRLGFDNVMCLLKCNSYYTTLRKLGKKSVPVFFRDASDAPVQYYNFDDGCSYDLNCKEKVYQRDLCKKQCILDSSFYTPYRFKRCFRLCEVRWN